MLIRFKNMIDRFRKDEDGLALTEYVILLALIAGAVVLAVQTFGEGLDSLWTAWASWMQNLASTQPPNV